MESLSELGLRSNDRWRAIRRVVEAATRPVELERLEDEVDAIFCAHLAWRWHQEPKTLRMYGTVTDGYIIATPPPTHPVASRVETPGAELAAEPEERTVGRAPTVAFGVDGVPATFATAGERP